MHAVPLLPQVAYILADQILYHAIPSSHLASFSELTQSLVLFVPLIIVEHLQDVEEVLRSATVLSLDPAFYAVDVVGESISIDASFPDLCRLLFDFDWVLLAICS
jgi:hypothetical protein